MTTNYNDFYFFAQGESSSGFMKLNENLNDNNGSPDNAGWGAVGHSVTNSSLSNPLPTSPNNNVGTHCRAWRYSEVGNYTGNAVDGTVSVAYLDDDAGGDHYPSDVLTSSVIAYSSRAFVRLDDPDGRGNTTATGTNVGLVHKGYFRNNQYFSDAPYKGFSNYADGTLQEGWYHTATANGYLLCLSNASTGGHDRTANLSSNGNNAGTNSAPRLILVAADQDRTEYTDATSQACTGTYAVNTWYHIRFDLIPNGGTDQLRAYTAPVTGAGSAAAAGIGNETWTLVGSLDIASSANNYRAWGSTNAYRAYSGYWNAPISNASSAISNGVFDPMIDRFQFLTKEVSS